MVALYWMLEIMPLAVTSLIPIVLFPLLEVADTGNYNKDQDHCHCIASENLISTVPQTLTLTFIFFKEG